MLNERIRPEFLEMLNNSKTLGQDPSLLLGDFKKLGDMTMTTAVLLVDAIKETDPLFTILALPNIFNHGVIGFSDLAQVDWSAEDSAQDVSMSCEVEIGATMYYIDITGVAVLDFSHIPSADYDVPEDCESKFVGLEDVEFHIYKKSGHEVAKFNVDFSIDDATKILEEYTCQG